MDDKAATVLIVEDEQLIRAVLAETLGEDGGFEVVEAATAEQALAILERQPAQVMITDVMMPGELDGIVLATNVAERWPDTAIIVISGWRGPDAGEIPAVAAFLAKPFRPSEVLRIVNDVMASKQEQEAAGAAFIPAGLKIDQLHTGIGAAAGLAQPLQEPDE